MPLRGLLLIRVAGVLLALAVLAWRIADVVGAAEFNAPPVEAASTEPRATPPRVLKKPVLLVVPMDQVPRSLVDRAVRRLRKAYGLEIEVVPRMRSRVEAFDSGRGQFSGGHLVNQIWRSYRARHPAAAVVGVTNADIYFQATDWRYALGVKDDSGYGVVSTARMDPRNWGEEPDENRLEHRLTAMLARYTAQLVFDLPRGSSDPRSVLRSSVMEPAELDEMTLWVCPVDPGSRRPC